MNNNTLLYFLGAFSLAALIVAYRVYTKEIPVPQAAPTVYFGMLDEKGQTEYMWPSKYGLTTRKYFPDGGARAGGELIATHFKVGLRGTEWRPIEELEAFLSALSDAAASAASVSSASLSAAGDVKLPIEGGEQ